MRSNQAKTRVLIMTILLFTVSAHTQAAIPVVDMDAVLRVIREMEEILVNYRQEILVYKDIIAIKDEYLRSMREIIFRSESLFNAITYFPKTLPGQYKNNPFFYDLLKKDTWGDLYHKDGRLEDRYPQLSDFSYILKNPLYKISKEFREYAQRLIEILKEETTEVENEFDFVRMIRQFQKKQDKLLDDFRDVIVPAFGSPGELEEEKKVVDVTRLYYAVCRAKIEVLKQKLELLLMEKELMENYLKGEVNQVRNELLYYKYQKLYHQ